MPRNTLLNTDTEDLQELLGNGKTYRVPAYQRDYSWRQEHWEDLWEDLINSERNGEDHYMGTVVLQVDDRKQFAIIDGQQRLATLSILISNCISVLNHRATEIDGSVESRERARLLEGSYIGAKDPSTLRVVPKLKLNSNDDAFFETNLMQDRPPVSVRDLRDSERLLWDCHRFFKAKVAAKFSLDRDGRAIAQFVEKIIAEKLIFITVQVQDQISAYTVFETLNARGIELTETDLLKNYLLSLADRLSQSQIKPLLVQWSKITDRAGVAKFPELLRHHLNSHRDYIRQKQLFKTVKNDVKTMDKVFPLLEKLEKDAAWFEALSDYSSDFWLDYQDAKDHVRVLNLFNVSQYTPLILAAKDVFDPGGITAILRCCAILSFRFNGVGHRSTHVLEEVYNKAALAIRNGSARTVADVREQLRPIYIPDTEFEADFSLLSIKNSGPSGKRLRYILAAIEQTSTGKDFSDEAMRATIEHILPENPADGEWEQFDSKSRERSINRLGNYALLERKPNNRLAANAAFAEKVTVYQQSQYSTTRDIADDYSEWTEDAIVSRQKKMARLAKGIWSLPL